MTGCPVLYAKPLLNESRFGRSEDTVAVTSTERGDFWKREAATIEFVARRFSASRRLMVIHQDYARAAAEGKLRRKLSSLFAGDKVSALRKLASARGFEVMVPATADEALSLYAKVDLHIGSRLHAHLHMLSRNRRSFLTKVDERVTGFAEHFGFPICDPLRLGDYMEFDFEPVRERARRTFDTMLKFVDSLGRAA